MPRIGPMELIIVLVIVLLIFGVGKLPQIGKSLGEGLKSFKQGVSGEGEEEKKTEEAVTEKPAEETKAASGEIDEPAKASEEDLAAFKKWQADQAKAKTEPTKEELYPKPKSK
jgi:sec-independent protein translocase protein TatA